VLEEFPSNHLKRLSEDSSTKSLKLTLFRPAIKKSNEQVVDHLILDVKLHDSKSLSKYGRKLLQYISQVREERRLHD
jgi:hypothetical protein